MLLDHLCLTATRWFQRQRLLSGLLPGGITPSQGSRGQLGLVEVLADLVPALMQANGDAKPVKMKKAGAVDPLLESRKYLHKKVKQGACAPCTPCSEMQSSGQRSQLLHTKTKPHAYPASAPCCCPGFRDQPVQSLHANH